MKSINKKKFGRDHWSLLVYVESRCVDSFGSLDERHMRDKHRSGWRPEWSTRIKSGSIVPEHDDFDCLLDLHTSGYIIHENNKYILTDEGYRVAGLIRRNRAEGRNYSEFKLEKS